MSRPIGAACAALALAVLLSGCGPGPEDQLVKEQIALFEQTAAAFEKVTDQKSYAAADAEYRSLSAKLAELDGKLKAAGAERKEAALKANADQYEQALARLKAAKEKAHRFAPP